MPLNLPDKLPAIELLKEENIFVIDNSRATQQDIRPLRIVILNLMPLKMFYTKLNKGWMLHTITRYLQKSYKKW